MPADQTIDFVVVFLVLGLLTLGLGSMALGWLVRAWDNLMSRPAAGRLSLPPPPRRFTAGSSAETNSETTEMLQRVAETEEAIFHSGENTAIARLIAAGVVKLTEGVREGTGKRSGDAYSKRSKEIQAIVKQMKEPEYPALAAQQRPSIVERS